jgi:hypothetical protein
MAATPLLKAKTDSILESAKGMRTRYGEDYIQGVYIKQKEESTGQKPCSRVSQDMSFKEGKLYTFGGASANVFSDIRSFDVDENVWRCLQPDYQNNAEFPGRFGHSLGLFNNFLVVWGGCGPYLKKMKKRACYGEVIAYDLTTNNFTKFEGGL